MEQIQNHLNDVADGRWSDKELFFDPSDGELKMVSKKDKQPDWHTLEQLAEDGFMYSIS